MAFSRYDIRTLKKNNSSLYEELFRKRDVKFINHYTTPEILKDAFESAKDFTYSYHVWSQGDRLYKLANQHYGSSELWWVIALVNSKPTESHFAIGDLVLIPQPLNLVLAAFGV